MENQQKYLLLAGAAVGIYLLWKRGAFTSKRHPTGDTEKDLAPLPNFPSSAGVVETQNASVQEKFSFVRYAA